MLTRYVTVGILLSMSGHMQADPLGDVDTLLKAIRQPIGIAASACALTTSIQTDIMGRDNARSKCSIRKFSQPVNEGSNYRDTLANTNRSVALFLRSLKR